MHNEHDNNLGGGYWGLLLSAVGWTANQLHAIDSVVTLATHVVGLLAIIGGAIITWRKVFTK